MNVFTKLLTVILAGCTAGLFLRGSPFRSLAALSCLIPAALLLAELIRPVSALILQLCDAGGMAAAALQPVLKAALIGILTQTASAFCADAGEQALQKLLELGGVIAVVYVSLPLYEAVLSMLQTLMEG